MVAVEDAPFLKVNLFTASDACDVVVLGLTIPSSVKVEAVDLPRSKDASCPRADRRRVDVVVGAVAVVGAARCGANESRSHVEATLKDCALAVAALETHGEIAAAANGPLGHGSRERDTAGEGAGGGDGGDDSSCRNARLDGGK